MNAPLIVSDLGKTFTMHLRDGIKIPVVSGVDFILNSGECAVLGGPSGAGKSSILKMLYGNYSSDTGHVWITHRGARIDLARAAPRQIMEIRRDTIGYVSQFLRTVPRVSALDVASEPLVQRGETVSTARDKAARLFERLNLPEKLWLLPPATFSGGEQQRVNIARGFITDHPILLLDEPTASLDTHNRSVVVELIAEKKDAGTALLGIFHDEDVRSLVADKIIDVTQFAPEKAA